MIIIYDCCRIEDHIVIHWVPPFYLQEVVFQVKTKGIVEELLPIDIDWEYKHNPVHQNWTFALNSYKFKVLDTMQGGVSFTTDSLMKNSSLSWKLGFNE